MKKILLIILTLGVLIGAYMAYSMYNKKHTNVGETAPVANLSALDLFTSFENNETEAMSKYADQVVAVSGDIYAIDLSNAKEPQIVLEANGDNGYIRCGFKPEELEKVKKLTEGNTVNLKGECKGVNAPEGLDLLADIDVVLSNCIIIE